MKTSWLSKQISFVLLLLSITGLITSCPNNPAPTSLSSLIISEVSSTRYNDDKPWFEVFNRSDKPIDLSDYKLRSLSQQRVEPWHFYGPTIFDIPKLILEPGQYAVIAGMGTDVRVNGDKIVYLFISPDRIPKWGDEKDDSGFIELLINNKTVDFVRFGNNKIQPLSPEAWSGPNVAALPSGLKKHGYSIVRDVSKTDTNSAADWSLRNFATAGGTNDVPAFAADVDEDGIPDSSEVSGSTFAGLDLYSMGARTNKKDIFIEIDFMNAPSHKGLIPQKAALDKLVRAFADNGINLHLDVGNFFSNSFSIENYNLGNKRSRVPYAKSVSLSHRREDLKGRANFYAYKDKYMAINRKQIFHYMLLASSRNPDGSPGSSGRAEIGGNDILITIGAWDLNGNSVAGKNLLTNFQAGTMMHELGHNLGLRHGGINNENYKPNYLSTMNYLYQIKGLGKTTGPTVGDRYYYTKGYKGIEICDLAQSPCSSSFVINYSHGRGRDINEKSFSENIGIGYGDSWVDYNNDGKVNNSLSLNINGDGVKDINAKGGKKLLQDYDDWANLNLLFIRTWPGNSGSTLALDTEVVDVVANDYQQWSEEEAPSEEFFDWLEQIR